MIKILRPDLSSNILEIIDLETNTHFYINGRDLTGRIFEFKDMYAVSVSEPEITLEYKNKFNYFNVAVLTSKNLDPTSYLYNSDLYQYATDLLTSFNESSGGGSNTSGNSYVLPIASASILGGVKIGSTLTINGSGILNVLNPTNNLNGSNGITRTGNFFKLGGNLDSPTFLNLNGTGYLNIGSSSDWNHTFSKTGGLSQSFNGNNAISYSDIGIQFKSLGGSFAKVDTSLLSTTRDYKFPNKSGTFAMLSDITGGGGENTTAGNGLSMIANEVVLGGVLNQNTTITTGSNIFTVAGSNGLRYATDISSNYTNRSLVDKQYVDNNVVNGTNAGLIGSKIFINKDVNNNLRFRTIVNGGGIGVSENGNTIELLNQHTNITDMNDTFFGTLLAGDIIQWDGGSWVNTPLNSNAFIRRDGSNSPTNDINWGTNSILNISSLSLSLSEINIEESKLFYNSTPTINWRLRQLTGGDWKIMDGYDLEFRNVANTAKTTLKTSETVDRDITFPDKSGTVALLSDITGGGENTTAGNGLSMSGNIVKLGGNLTENTILNGTNFNITFNVNDFIVNASTNTILLKTNNVENLKIDYTGLTTNNKKTELISGLSSFKLNKTNNDEAELIADNFSIKTDNDVSIESGNLNINSGGTKFASVITTGLTDNRTFQFPDVSGMLVTNNILNSYETFGSNGITKTGNTFELGGYLNNDITLVTFGSRIFIDNKRFESLSTNTVNAVTINLWQDTTELNSSNVYKVEITNVNTSPSPTEVGFGNTWHRTFKVKNVGGVVTLGTIQSDFTETENTSSINIYLSGVDIRIDGTGQNLRAISWDIKVEKIKLEI
jgi:hypothetical protein